MFALQCPGGRGVRSAPGCGCEASGHFSEQSRGQSPVAMVNKSLGKRQKASLGDDKGNWIDNSERT